MNEKSPLNRTLDLLWEGRPPSTKGPKPALNLEQIVDTGVKVADTEGVEALSMRRIARELDVGTMSLYRYVPDKTVLLNLMLNKVLEPGVASSQSRDKTWREMLEADARHDRVRYLAHPWLLQVNAARPILGPNALATVEIIVSRLANLPLSDQEKIGVISAVEGYVTGCVRHEIMYSQAAEESGITDSEFWESQYPYMERAMASGDYPAMAAMDEDTFEATWEESFEQGLKYLLDGIEQNIKARTNSGASPDAND